MKRVAVEIRFYVALLIFDYKNRIKLSTSRFTFSFLIIFYFNLTSLFTNFLNIEVLEKLNEEVLRTFKFVTVKLVMSSSTQSNHFKHSHRSLLGHYEFNSV